MSKIIIQLQGGLVQEVFISRSTHRAISCFIYSRDLAHRGRTTGGTRPCNLEGCRGTRVAVRWNDGKLTYPCTAGMKPYKKGWKII